jgi:hypothetical protein
VTENSSTQVPQGEDLANQLQQKIFLSVQGQARCHADVEKSDTKALKTYLAEAHPKKELLPFVGGEFDGFHVQDHEGEPAIQEDDEEKIMMAGVCTSFLNGDTAADDTGF